MPSALGRRADRDHLGMGGRDRSAGASRCGLSAMMRSSPIGDDRADRHFARRGRFARQIERAAHRRRKRKGHRRRLAQQPDPVRPCRRLLSACWSTGAAWLSAGWLTWTSGTLTVASLAPTVTEPVSTSNAGVWPPLCDHPVLGGRNIGGLGAADLVDVDEAVPMPARTATHQQDQDDDDCAHDFASP